MKAKRRVHRGVLLLGLAALATIGIAEGTAQASAVGERSPVVDLRVKMSAQRFVAHGNTVTAVGPLFAKATRSSGATTVVRKRARLRVNATGDCRILELKLAQLYLNLLGLKVQTSAISAEITGNQEAVLGRLFCSLSEGIKLNNTTLAHRAAKSINRSLHGHSLRILAFEAPLRPQGAAGASSTEGARVSQIAVGEGECEVLNLLLGPLHLELLGLVVDLYGKTPEDAVQVLVTGNPSGGLLGNVLCSLTTAPPAP